MTDDAQQPESGLSGSVLDVIARLTGEAPRVELRREDSTGAAPGDDMAQRAAPLGRGNYRLLGEIARGGMGVVLRGRDQDLRRDVALKVLHAGLAQRPDSVMRFVEEAQISGQLQHPGIAPVYELGLLSDQRPYFSMKLIRGRTFAELLLARDESTSERRRMLDIFASVCQTMAYVHSRGVIHRDLKPANVMVGAYGEVQVVDWGLAKLLTRDETPRASASSAAAPVEPLEVNVREQHSLVGTVMGTLAYMPPEQARGEVGTIDVAVAVDPEPRRVAIRRALAAKDEDVLLELAERGAQTPLDPQTAVSLATGLIGFRHLEAAAEMLATSVEAHPGEFALHRMLGFVFDDLGEPYRERAQLHYTAALALQPSSVNALYGLAELAVDAGDLKRAEQLYRRGLEINPDHYASWHALALILTDEKEHERCLRRCIELWPTGWEAKLNLGRLLHMTDRAEESVALLREVVEVAPDSFLAWNHLGTACGKAGDRLTAIAAQRRAIELQPDDISSLFNLAIELRGLGQVEDALEFAQRALELAPEHPLLNYGVGENLILLGREAEGLERVEWLLRAEPDSVHANGWVARLAANAADTSLRDPKRALACAEVVLAAAPGQVAAGLSKSLALLRSGEFEAALAAVDNTARIPSTMFESLELTRALALCGLERRDEARAVLAALGDVRDDSGEAYSRRERDRLLEELRAALAR